MTSSDYRLGITLALGAAVCFGLSHTVVVLAYSNGASPLTVSATRFALPVLALSAYFLVRGEAVLLPRRQFVWTIGLGLLTGAYNLALLIALKHLPAGVAMLVFYLFPLMTGVLAAAMGWGALDRKMGLAAIVALFGLALTLGVKYGDYSLFGLGMSVAAAVGLAVVSVFSKPVIAASDPLRATNLMSLGALVSLAIVVAGLYGFQWPKGGAGWAGFLLCHLFYAIGVVAFFMAIDKVGAPMTATLGNLQPVVVIAVAFAMLGQTLTVPQLLGAAIVVAALVTVARRGPAAKGTRAG